MWKTLVVLAFVASTVLITPSEGTSGCKQPTTTSKPCSGNSGPSKPHRKCPKPNEVFDSCPAPCPPRECGVNKALILCAPAPEPGSADCQPGCRCIDGYVRNKAGDCIPENQCPIKCPKNETLDPCLSSCPPRECGVNIAAVSCLAQDPDDCQPGCRCKDEYLRNADGFCVLAEDCPKCPKNEVYDVCPAPCPPRRCDVDERVIRCKAPPKPGDPECQPGCRCADGYVRNNDDQCVTRDQCPKCTGSHEVFDPCPSTCPPQTCESINKTYHCPKAPTKCPNGTCVCEPGYYRNKLGECISEEKCLLICGDNEIISECPDFECRPLNCSQVGFPVTCPEDQTKCPGKAACVCDKGYARNSDGKCVPLNECPSCGGDSNARSGCGVNCGSHCSNLKDKEPVSCITICYLNACDCKEGFYFDDNTKKCVLPKHCTPVCGKDEVYSDCINGGCQPKNCSQLGFPIPCRKIDPANCIKGCLCKDGYVRAKNGTCIPKENCPSCGGDPNKVSGCGVNCGRHCSDKGKGQSFCPAICNTNGCDCRKGLVVDDSTGNCFPPDQCVSCGGDYNAEPGCDKDGSRRCPGFTLDDCNCYKNSCRCKNGFLYDPKLKKCVHPDSCSSPCGDYEVLSNCSNGGCGPWTCSDVGFPTGCVKMDQKYCKVGCICIEGYVKENGTCIPATQCPSCGGDANATSGCGVNCGRYCSNLKDKEPVSCITICYPNACDCKKGFYFDDNTKKCVLPKHCTPVCGEDEVYSDCINGDCQPKNCSQLGFPIPCRKIDPENCIKGCLCKDGYVRAKNGTCIPKEDCPSCGGDPNKVSGCGVNCGRHCSDKGKGQSFCPAICNTNGCDCRKGLVVDDSTGNCIPHDQCVSCGGDYNAEPGCDKDGSRRCPSFTLDDCNCYKNSCRCKNGFLYDPKLKKCVRPDSCSSPCGDYEVLSNCSNGGCGPWTCSDVGFPTGCVKMDQKYCKVGCICIEGYVKENGTCIPATQCPSCGGDVNATAGCGINCGRLCSNYDKEPVACTAICIGNACECKKKFVWDENTKKCVLPKDCTPVCGDNEVFSECVNGGCQAKNCSQLGKPVPCVKPLKCKPGCLCADGYLRADNGTCVPKDQCPQICTGPNEVYDPCPPVCPPQTCESIGQKYFCPFIPANKTSKDCNGACRCKPGYLRNKIGECVSVEDCKPCGENERLEQCPDWLCSPQSCKDLGFPLVCPELPSDSSTPCPGPPKCVCDIDYVRDKNGKCISQTECPSCGGDPNAKPGCGINCGKLCSNYNKGPVPCPKICKVNACDCKKKFVYDSNTGKCVLPKDCTPTCGDDEVYSECINGGCQAKNCSQLGKPVPCIKIDPKYCIKGCLCKEGYLRADNGTCVPEDQCNPCKNPHEHYDACAPTCPPQTCESIGHKYKCPIAPQYCKGACRCDEGYYRNKIGECISEKNCSKCKGPHEYFSCRGACDNVCSKLSYENQTNCPIKNVNCNPMCYCEEGYARNDTKICVPIDECPVPKCGPNERLEQCPASLCTPQTCSQLGFPIPCPALSGDTNATCPGPPGCVCDSDDHVRNAKGECIPKDKCPSCGGDPNATTGCGIHCGNRCSNYKTKTILCPLICIFNSCDCKKGYVYDDNLKKCVLPKDCTPVCGDNEVYDTCANGGCQKRNCSQAGESKLCLDPIKCIGGCVCAEGYLRAKNGSCIPEDQCPGICRQPNEVYDPCPPICPPQTCESIGKSYSCPAMIIGGNCTGSCRCKKGYYRNKIGQCISEEDCLKCTGPHEYFSCGGACDNVCADLSKQNQTNCPIRNIKCNPMCYCEEGYARNNKSICVPIDQCPAKVCGINEVYATCANGGCDKRNCSQLDQPALCIDPIKCIGGCICQKGHLRADNGTCVPEDQCPFECTQPHEVLDPCPPSCPPQTCDSIGKVYPCPLLPPDSDKYCKPACRCEDGYYRNIKGECISKKDCLKCTGPNEYFSCGVACDNECATLQIQNQTHCPIINKKCNPKCYCYEGYARDNNGICIPIEQCGAPCTGANEVFNSCPSTCPPQTCESLDRAYICPIETGHEPPCIPGCICKDGYFRNKRGECITEEECLKCRGPNEYFSCGGACDNVCETLNEQNQTDCPIVNIVCNPMCYCESEYARNKSNICIPIEECPAPRCGPNERYEENPSKVCYPLDCSEVGFPMDCPPVQDPDCEDTPACICKQGYVRDCGVCIPISQCPPTNTTTPPSKVNATEARELLDEGNIAFTGELLYQLVSSNPDKNYVASATSVLFPLAQLALFTVGTVYEQLHKVLNIDKDQIVVVFPILTNDFANQSNVEFTVATTYFANIQYPLSNKFITYSHDYFRAGGQNVDFSKTVEAAETINGWVSNQTNGRIDDLVTPDMFSADTRLALVNAIYFKGNWKYQFNPNNTKTKDFTKRNGDTVPVEMMYQQNSFNYAETDDYQVVQMVYENDNFSFIAILPKDPSSLTDIAHTLEDPQVFQDILNNLIKEKVQVYLPKFLIESDIDLVEILNKLNITEMFVPDNNEIVGVLNNDEPLYVSAAIQKAFVEVNEQGSEAAAATAIVISTRSLPINPEPIYIFNADHPFLFYIAFKGTVLFCGAFVE